jgi:hypothetical protein
MFIRASDQTASVTAADSQYVTKDEMIRALRDEIERLADRERAMADALSECRKIALAGYWAAGSRPEESKFEAIDAIAKAILAL